MPAKRDLHNGKGVCAFVNVTSADAYPLESASRQREDERQPHATVVQTALAASGPEG